MRKRTFFLSLTAFCLGISLTAAEVTESGFRQTYPLAPEKVKSNAQRFAEESEKLQHSEIRNLPAVYYVVPPLSDLPRLPDSYPDDGILNGSMRLLATPGEFEPGSFVVYPLKNVDRFEITASDLQSEQGATIPASSVDLKLVKCWYQAGSGWYGFFADALNRVLVPELLLNDETLIKVVPETKDNYVRYENQDGSTVYQWMSANFAVVNYSFDNQANSGLIADAETLQPVVLNKDEFKQFFVTVHVPQDAVPGIYRGTVNFTADGVSAGSMPVILRVLPFSLPAPKSNYNRDKGFYLCLYGADTRNPDILRNMAEHNAVTPKAFPYVDVFQPDLFREDVKLARACGISTDILFAGAEGVNVTMPENLNAAQIKKLERLKRIIAKTGKLTQDVLGHTNFYSYGVDEGSPSVIRTERAAWKIAHDAGGKV